MLILDDRSSVPPYEQIRIQLAAQVSHGVLPAGTRLSTVRRLAGDLGLAVNTVVRAYRELAAAGLVETRGRAGTVVIGHDPAHERVRCAAQAYVALARETGFSAEEALRVVRSAFEPDADREK